MITITTFRLRIYNFLYTILYLVSDLTRNRPWASGEVQLAPSSFALPFYGVWVYDRLTTFSLSAC